MKKSILFTIILISSLVAKSQVSIHSTLTYSPTVTDTLDASLSELCDSYSWRKISGPECTIVSPNSGRSVVKGMTPGVYEFELTGILNGMIGKDTVVYTITDYYIKTNK